MLDAIAAAASCGARRPSMDRRGFIKTTGTLIAGATLVPGALAAERDAPAGTDASGRIVLPMNRGWLYSHTAEDGATGREFNDAQFEHVVVPHTNIKLPWHGFTEHDYTFVSTYRRHFKLPESAMGRRVFVDFEGVMTASTVWLNGHKLGEYKGGYTPFSFELTAGPQLDPSGDNVLAVEVDSTERPDIPPFGYEIDYLTFGGIYREVSLRIVPETFLENIFAAPKNVMTQPAVDVKCYLEHPATASHEHYSLTAEVLDGDRVLGKATKEIPAASLAHGELAHTVEIAQLDKAELWDLDHPRLYQVRVRLMREHQVVDEQTRRIGFREATFTDHGFSLNGKIVKLRGLDRHQTFPYVGQAMPGRVQRRDADILRTNFHCNIVRTSHYPQSRHFLDRCDEIGLLVLEEIPGWQHIGDLAWQDIAVDNVGRMIRRDWNRPSIVLWGVRINESRDNHDFYTRTNALAHQLDTTRQTGGIRYFQESEFLEDVFTMNDFGWPLKKPNHPRYLNTEFVGHTYPCKTFDSLERLREHTIRHARVHDTLASDPQYAGGIGWCAFDYNTHANFGSGDRICYHGVADIFREPKPAAFFYKSQCDPAEEIVLEPAFHWARNDESVGLTKGLICSNCDHVKIYTVTDSGEHLLAEADPDRTQFPHLKYAPFDVDFGEKIRENWGDLRIDGYIGGKRVISKRYSGDGVDHEFVVQADDTELVADGADTTRVVLRMNDHYGAIRPFASDGIALELEGPGTLIGDNPATLIGGAVAVWVRAGEQPGSLTLRATHPRHGTKEVRFTLKQAEAEQV
jgi:beta-galactosidase